MRNKQIEARAAFPSAEALLAKLLKGRHLNPIAEAKAVKKLGIEGQEAPKILGELKTNGAPIGRAEPVEAPKVSPNGS